MYDSRYHQSTGVGRWGYKEEIKTQRVHNEEQGQRRTNRIAEKNTDLWKS